MLVWMRLKSSQLKHLCPFEAMSLSFSRSLLFAVNRALDLNSFVHRSRTIESEWHGSHFLSVKVIYVTNTNKQQTQSATVNDLDLTDVRGNKADITPCRKFSKFWLLFNFWFKDLFHFCLVWIESYNGCLWEKSLKRGLNRKFWLNFHKMKENSYHRPPLKNIRRNLWT